MKTAEGSKANVTQQVQFIITICVIGVVFETVYLSQLCLLQKSYLKLFSPVQEMMPLQYIYTMALEQDIKNSLTSKRTSEMLQNRCYQVQFAHIYKKSEFYQIFSVFQRSVCSNVFNLVSLSQRPWLPRKMRLTSGVENSRSSGQKNKGRW